MLLLARHAQPDIAPGTCYGQLDMAADRQATHAAAEALAAVLPDGIRVISSPLRRCEQLARALGRPFTTDTRLGEMHFGAWEGQPWAELPRHELDAWTASFADYAPGGGESVGVFMARVAAAFGELAAPDTLWITHAGVIRAATLIAAGQRTIERADQWPGNAPSYGQWCTLDPTIR
jgi:alpha-ribazole phosphatase